MLNFTNITCTVCFLFYATKTNTTFSPPLLFSNFNRFAITNNVDVQPLLTRSRLTHSRPPPHDDTHARERSERTDWTGGLRVKRPVKKWGRTVLRHFVHGNGLLQIAVRCFIVFLQKGLFGPSFGTSLSHSTLTQRALLCEAVNKRPARRLAPRTRSGAAPNSSPVVWETIVFQKH